MHNASQLQLLFENYVTSNFFNFQPRELYTPINYILESGGKRLRPVLLLMSFELFAEDLDKAMPAAFAVELFHNFSLLHDDIMDKAPLRRGRPAAHIKFGINAGILSGDAMLIYVYKFLSKYTEESLVTDLIRIFNKVGIEVCEGQQYDLNFENQTYVELSEYLKMIELKTAALLEGCMRMGARIAGASAHDQDNVGAFARNIGMAFQLQDDILDTFGDPGKFGKKLGGDITQNKKTYLIIKSLEIAEEPIKSELQDLLFSAEAGEEYKIQMVKDIFIDLGVQQLAEEQKLYYLDSAFSHLQQVKNANYKSEPLRQLAYELMNREA